MPQTRFVTQKAFEMGLKPIVVVNKIDRPGVDPHEVMDQVFELFVSLGATDEQLDFPVIYASGRQGYAIRELGDEPQGPRPDPRPDRREGAARRRRSRRAAAACRSRRSITTTTSATWRSAACAPAARRSAIACCSRTATARRKSSASRRSSASRASSASSSPRPIAGNIVAFTGMENLNVGETITSIAEADDPAAAQDRRADDHDELPRQRRPVRGQGRQVRHVAQPRRAPPARAQEQRRAARRGDRRRRRVPRLGPRRAPPDGAHRDDAPRGLRAVRRAAAGDPPDRRRTARRTEPYEDAVIDLDENYVGAGRRRAQPPPRHDARDAPVGARAARASSTGSRRAA